MLCVQCGTDLWDVLTEISGPHFVVEFYYEG